MEVGGQRHAPAALPPGKTRYPLYRTLGGPQGRSGRVRKNLAPHRDSIPEPPSTQRVAIPTALPQTLRFFSTQFLKEITVNNAYRGSVRTDNRCTTNFIRRLEIEAYKPMSDKTLGDSVLLGSFMHSKVARQ